MRPEGIFDNYRVFQLTAKAETSVPTLNEIVDQVKVLIPAVQATYSEGRARLIPQMS